MKIIFKKGRTKNSITCERDDGTSTWMQADAFMIAHDLTHYAVETVLRVQNGFYGLLSSGLDITDFEKKQKINPRDIPKEAIKAEVLVNLFLTEANDGALLEDFALTFSEAAMNLNINSENFGADKLDEVRRKLLARLEDWNSLPIGASLIFAWEERS